MKELVAGYSKLWSLRFQNVKLRVLYRIKKVKVRLYKGMLSVRKFFVNRLIEFCRGVMYLVRF